MKWLLDTNVVSELVKTRKNPGLLDWLASTEEADHRISAMSIGEIRRGAELLYLRRDLQQARRLEVWLEATVVEYRQRIVPIDMDIAQRWGRFAATRPVSTVDGLIGATADVHHWTVVTRNVKHFAPLEVEVHNPFTPEEP